MSELPLSKRLAAADEPTLREMLREAEVHLASQQTVALAADQRAMTITGFFAAAAVVLIGGASGYAIGDKPNVALSVICILVAAALLGAIWFAVRAAAPAGFDFAGSSPADWVRDIEARKPLNESLAEMCAHFADSIDANHKRMEANAKRLWTAIWIAFGALGVGGAAFILTLALS
ncbi:hypothetical protein [Antarcticirhabdus aurantiaca]|uniref:Uncharacterized protein n=1 Tax=Antarcticirhabdus aurantiaca TaxID=2606717 RepID=A0ACD4NL68_9HYPH|nr:hypothetical protein [Antarcticirhabdus aurantiaca]WAJ27538.1 hypothetical protein OXU80_22255 [Jeongeuplla avenae]